MLGRSAVQYVRVRNAVGIAVALAAASVAAPATASTSPLTGSAGSSDTGSSVVDLGSSVVDLGSSIVGSGSSGLFAPTQRCDESTLSGGEGITDTVHQLGRGGGRRRSFCVLRPTTSRTRSRSSTKEPCSTTPAISATTSTKELVRQ